MALDYTELNAIEKFVSKAFAGAFKIQPVNYQAYTTEIQSTELIEFYEFLGTFPLVREWIGARQYEDLTEYDYSLKNKKWELTQRYPYKWVWEKSRTVLGQLIRESIGRMGASFKRDYPSRIIIGALEAGTTNLAYDGQPFYSNAGGDKIIDNLLAGTGTSVDQIIVDINAARLAANQFVDEKGRILEIVLDTAVIPPGLETQFREITGARLRSATDNIYFGSLKYIVEGRLTDPDDWFFHATNEFIKPILFQNMAGVRVAIKDDTFDHEAIIVGADAAGNVGYTFPHLSIKTVN